MKDLNHHESIATKFGKRLALGIAAMSLSMLGQVALAQAAPLANSARPDALFGAPRQIDTTAGKLAVYQVGSGPQTIVYWGSVLTDHTMYRNQAAQLGDGYRQIFIDGPGHGASGAQAPGATLTTHATAVTQVMDALGVPKATFVGTSWGGLVGAHLARDAGHRVQALVALNTPFDVHADGPAFSDRITVWMARWFCNSGMFADGAADAFFAKSTAAKHPEAVAVFKARLADQDCKSLSDAVRTVLIERTSAHSWLGRVQVPVYVVAGRQDAVYPPERAQRSAALITGSQILVVDDAAHLAALESPVEVNRIIVRAVRTTLTQ